MEEEKWLKYYKPIELKKGLHGVCEMYESIKNFSLKSLSLMCLYLLENIVYYWAATQSIRKGNILYIMK